MGAQLADQFGHDGPAAEEAILVSFAKRQQAEVGRFGRGVDCGQQHRPFNVGARAAQGVDQHGQLPAPAEVLNEGQGARVERAAAQVVVFDAQVVREQLQVLQIETMADAATQLSEL